MTAHEWHDLIHLGAALVLTAGGAVFVASAWRRRADGRGSPPPPGPAPSTELVVARTLAILLVALTFGAAVIHLAAAPEHLQELGALGVGFPLAAALQAMWAGAWWLRPGDRLAWLGLLLNTAIALAWTWSRVVGLPTGQTPWQPEAAGVPDLASTIFEVAIVVLLVARLAGQDVAIARRARNLAAIATVTIVPAVGVVFLATLLAVNVAAGAHGHASAGDGQAYGGADAGHATP